MLAFSNDYYGMIFRATQSVELSCAYDKKTNEQLQGKHIRTMEKGAYRLSVGSCGSASKIPSGFDFICQSYLLKRNVRRGKITDSAEFVKKGKTEEHVGKIQEELKDKIE